MATTLNYIEYKATKPDGEVVYSESSSISLPPQSYDYVLIEQINHYMNGTIKTFTLTERTPAEVKKWTDRKTQTI